MMAKFAEVGLSTALGIMLAAAAPAGKPMPESDPQILAVTAAGGGASWVGGVDRARGTHWLALCSGHDTAQKAWGDCSFFGLEIEPDFLSANDTRVDVYDKGGMRQTCDKGASGWTCAAGQKVVLPFYNCPAGTIC